nr:immunoglobulin light chain junction region [Macaca mulatta]MOY06348.1 immunoglobulin light chain junction region [Macaca mulatta]MOY08782.1 immunoglobulin light chain junction region [Macaca mulatta]
DYYCQVFDRNIWMF